MQLILKNAALEDVVMTDQLTATIQNDNSFGSIDMDDELINIYTVMLGHVAKKDIQPQEEQYAELCTKMKENALYYQDDIDVFDSKFTMSKCTTAQKGHNLVPVIQYMSKNLPDRLHLLQPHPL